MVNAHFYSRWGVRNTFSKVDLLVFRSTWSDEVKRVHRDLGVELVRDCAQRGMRLSSRQDRATQFRQTLSERRGEDRCPRVSNYVHSYQGCLQACALIYQGCFNDVHLTVVL